MVEEIEKQYKVAICDDEKLWAEKLTRALQKLGYKFEMVYFFSGEELLASSLEFSILFLDIKLGGLDGFFVAEQLQKCAFPGVVIFTTGYTDHFAEAFRLNAFRYLIKPIQLSKLKEAVEAAEKRLKQGEELLLMCGGKVSTVKMTEIVCVRASRDESVFCDVHGRETISNKPLAYWKEVLLEKEFFLVHRSFLIALQYVERMPRNGEVKVKGVEKPIPVSRLYVKQLREGCFQYMKKHGIKLI